MDGRSGSRVLRAAAVVTLATVAAGAIAGVSTGAAKPLTKKRALKLFYTKGGADERFVNVGEISASSSQQTNLILNFVGPGNVLTHSVNVPRSGVLLVWANVSFEEDAGTPEENPVHATVMVDGTDVGTVQESNIPIGGFNSSESIANALSTPVTAGPHTVALEVDSVEGSEIAIEGRSITTLFIPA
jgi:hypothetical protein